ncbi:MAG: TldD/PmbA family protein [Candidatus Cloacimonetes bacterium]|nr:TldD/PmbA family protein [Candidatus Cloacimonadota bacterium]
MLNKNVVSKVLERALENGADFAEIFVEDQYSANIRYFDQKTQKSVAGKSMGAGIRVFFGLTAIYAYTNDLSEESLLKTAYAAGSALKNQVKSFNIDLRKKEINSRHPFIHHAKDIAKSEKVDFLRKIDKSARAYHNQIVQVDMTMIERNQKVLIANSEGLWAEDERRYSRIATSAIASNGTEMQTGGESPGALQGFEFFRMLDPVYLGEESAKSAITMLNADYVQGGKYPVIIDNGFGGVIFHEACGHSLETTSVAKGASVFCNKMGEMIANPAVTAIDDGTIENHWGSTNIDDEGHETQKTVLIENGILKSYIVDKLGGMKMNMPSTGSGRRESYTYAPTSRMRNTYIAAGPHKLEELIASVDYGIYAKKMGGGSVTPGTGNFNFSVAEGYLIEKGKIGKAIRGATLIGNGADALHKISMVADNLAFAEGNCGSVSGSVPTCVGQPAIKIDEIVVGGR